MRIKTMNTEDLCSNVQMFALADNTRKAYRKGWASFTDYCHAEKIPDPLAASPDTVADFLVHLATQPSRKSGQVLSMGTVALYNSAITSQFANAGKTSPTHHPAVRATLKGLARFKGTAPRRVKALRESHIQAMLDQCPSSPIGRRDAAILALGFAGALRRSELCGLTVADIQMIPPVNGGPWRMVLTIRKSKTDQAGKGQKIAIPEGKTIHPIHRLQEWMSVSGITRGPVFQTMKRGGSIQGKPLHHSDIPRLIKYYAKQIGLNPKEVAGHSLRAGFVTSAAVHRARLDKIMEVTRHTNPATVMKYIRDADSFKDHAGEMFL